MNKIKKDKFLKVRGGNATFIDIVCVKCNETVLHYQKDGIGWLKRCYLNRIFGPNKWSSLQNNLIVKEPNDMQNLTCDCGNLIGVPMRHKDGRLAYRLEKGSFKRKKPQSF